MRSKEEFLIAGGGLGGLAAALALARKGHRSIVLEQAPQFGEIGAGIQIAPNALRALDALGICERVLQNAVLVDELVLMDAVSGERITSIPLREEFRSRFSKPYAVIHRADLHRALLDSCQEDPLVTLRVSSRVRRYEQDGRTVTVILESGEKVKGTALIGADGLWSAIRQQLVGDGAPIVSGHTTFRSVIPTAKMPEELRWNAATLWAGPKCHLVHYPLKGWELFNLVITVHNGASEPVAGEPVSLSQVRASFPAICAVAAKIIEHGENWKRWVLCDREPISNWVDGRVSLLGDAAHPMLQYLAQGACMALEDAVCLAQEVEQHDDVHRALKAYAARRAPRTGRVQLCSRLIGDFVYHADGAHADIRNAALHAKTAEGHYNTLAWLFDPATVGETR